MDVNLRKFKRKGERVGGFIVQAYKHSSVIMLFIFFLCGLIFGSVLLRTGNVTADVIVSAFKNYNGVIVSNSFTQNFINLLFSNGAFLFFTYIFGLCAIGAPIICAVPFIKGVGIGVVSAYLYKTYELSGFGYCMLVYYPAQLINMFTILLCSNESYKMSKDIYNNIKSSNVFQGENELKLYHVRYIFFMLLYLFSSLIGSLLNTYLSSIFTF